MKRIYLLVEGQTEETFVKELLQPSYSQLDLFFTPILVRTSRSSRGGVVRFQNVKRQIERLCKQHPGGHVSTMFDLYALPRDFPGRSDPAYVALGRGQLKAEYLEEKLANDIGKHNFIPNLVVHEFEALLFTEIEAFESWADPHDDLDSLRVVREATLPEDVNEGQTTAPSKRILAAMAKYQKPIHGPLIAMDIGLGAMRAVCPHFHGWLTRIEDLLR